MRGATIAEWGEPDEEGRGEFILIRPDSAEVSAISINISPA